MPPISSVVSPPTIDAIDELIDVEDVPAVLNYLRASPSWRCSSLRHSR